MLTEKQKKICEKYSAKDSNGFVHCADCPLVIGTDLMCRANASYNRHTREWKYDEEEGDE